MSYKVISIKITTCDIYIAGYMSNVHCTGDSVVVLHAFEIPPLPYSSGPCKFNCAHGQDTLQLVLTVPFSTQVYEINEYQPVADLGEGPKWPSLPPLFWLKKEEMTEGRKTSSRALIVPIFPIFPIFFNFPYIFLFNS